MDEKSMNENGKEWSLWMENGCKLDEKPWMKIKWMKMDE